MNKFKSLGEISEEEQKEIWANKMSGSQVKRLYTEPARMYYEKKGIEEAVDLNAIPGLAKRLAMGNYMEPIIIEIFKDLQDLDIKTTKETYVSTKNPFLTCNIDGYIGEDINNIDYIIEVKNTSVKNTKELIDRYLPQLDYYMNFFNAKIGGKFLFFTNGWDTKVVTIKRNMERELEMEIMIEDFQEALITDTPPPEFEFQEEVIEVGDISDVVDEFQKVNKERLRIEKVEKSLKATIEESFGKKIGIAHGTNFKVKKIEFQKSGYTDYKTIAYQLAQKYDEDIVDLEINTQSKGWKQSRLIIVPNHK